ncbi:MAG: BlaI/MecI/CopY family transcriptional regulator [Armatimonas sp.]
MVNDSESSSRPPRLGRQELRILKILWRLGAIPVRQITEALNAEPEAALMAHSTVQTLLRKLEAKNAVGHREEGRVFLFFALLPQEQATEAAADDLLRRVFGGSVYGLVAHFLEKETLSKSEREQLRALIDQSEDS